MTTLPPIPDDVWDAAMAAAKQSRVPGTEPLPDAITAVWPHLYAAALRHAADELPGPTSQCGDYAAPGSEWREDYERRGAPHWPDGHAPWPCDGCSAAQSADREAAEAQSTLRRMADEATQ